MGISVNLPEMNIKEDEVKLLLVIKLLEDGIVSLGKAAEIAGLTREEFISSLSRFKVSPFQYTAEDIEDELRNAD